MKRRELILAAGALAAAPALHAQAPRMKRVAIADQGAPETTAKIMPVFKARLAELGWIEGRNIEFRHAYAHHDAKRHEPVVAELLTHRPDVIFAWWGPIALVAKKLTQEVPIVFAIASTPEQTGLVASLARPGGNVTGGSTREREFVGKRVELLRELVPGMRRFAVLADAANPVGWKLWSERYGAEAQRLGLQLVMLSANSQAEFAPAMDSALRDGVQGIVGIADTTHFSGRVELAKALARARLPAIYPVHEYVDAGVLMSYGIDNVEQFRRAADFVNRILRGAKPAEMPVEEPTNFVLALNLTTARTLGIKIPQSVLLRATRVIE